ncbi:thiamine pyrophosphate-binding protein [Polymorphobacter sp.]|uniref:thiamine pyrophosphate-binding protein n=1 Tax=Polymorphobacter sp. TaxID=1909290 RepID=UPI003F6FDCDC
MKSYEALAAALAAEGVDTVFGMLGNGVLDLSRELADRHGIRFVPARHEEVAVGMADGYSRATGRIGVAIICFGPGLANASATFLAARMSGSKLLAIVGGAHGADPHNNMSYEQLPLLQATIGMVQDSGSPATLARDIGTCFRHLRHGHGPIALHYLGGREAMPEGWQYQPAPVRAAPPLAPEAADIETLAGLVEAAARPLILVGRGVYLADGKAAARALAEAAGGLLATTLLTKDWLDDDPYCVGLSGGFSAAGAARILNEADLVVALGASLNDYTFGHGLLYRGVKVVHVDVSPAAIGDYRQPDVAVLGDARLVCEALVSRLGRIDRPGWRDGAVAGRIAGIDRWEGLDMAEAPGAANPRRIVEVADRLLPRPRILTTDIGLFMAVPAAHLSVDSPADIVFPWQLGRVGCGLAVAMGAAMGRPEAVAACFVGDGGMMASTNALATLADEKLPVVLFVMDDNGLGAERRLFQIAGVQSTIADQTTPDLVAIATAYGIEAVRVTSGAALEEYLAARPAGQGPLLVHVIIDSAIPTSEMDAAYYTRPHN